MPTKHHTALTPRERVILERLWEGLTNDGIARKLKISVKTVEAHRANIYRKWRVKNTVQALRVALKQGLIR